MKSKWKRIFAILLSVVMCFNLCGCWNSRELNTLAFVTSMGFDKTDKGILMTVQVFNPRAIASQKTVNETSVIVYTQEGKDIMEMIRRMITQSPRKLNVTHLQTVIFGEDFAKDGISMVLDVFTREHQFRADMYFAVAHGTTANNILKTQTKLETNPSNKLFSSLKSSDEIWAGNKAIKLIELVNVIIADGNNAAITGVELANPPQDKDNMNELQRMEEDPVQIKNLAVFNKDKFVGWINEDECKGYNYLTGNISDTVGIVESKEVGKITMEVTHTDAKRSAAFVKGKPSVNVEIHVDANIENVVGAYDITKEKNLNKIEKLAAEKVEGQCLGSLMRTKEYGCDIYGFGELIHRTYPQYWKTVKNNWNKEFRNLPVSVKVDYKILATGPQGNPFFEKENK